MLNRLLGVLAVLLFLPGVYLTLADWIPAPHQEDFGAYYIAAKALASGESPYDPHIASRIAAAEGIRHHSPYIYPPLLAFLLRPLAALPYSAAAAIWFVSSACALLAALWRLQPVVQVPWHVYGWLCAAALFLPPVHHTLQQGQITNFLLLLIVTGAVGATVGPTAVGVAAALKVFPATLTGAYALTGRWSALVMMIASAGMLTLSGALAEPAATGEFVRRVGPELAVERRLAPNNQSVEAVTARWFESHWFVTPIIDAPMAGRIASIAIGAVVVGLTLWTLVVRRSQAIVAQVEPFSLVLAATLLVSPIVWDHYYVLLLLPVAVLYRSSHDRAVSRMLLVGVVLLLSHRYWPVAFALKSPLFMSEGFAGVLVLWIALLKVLSYDRVCAVTQSPSATSPSAT